MEAEESPVQGAVIGDARCMAQRGRPHTCYDNPVRAGEEQLILVLRSFFRRAALVVVILRQPLAQLAPAIAMHHWLVAVHAQGPGNRSLVGVEIHGNDYLTECLQQQRH